MSMYTTRLEKPNLTLQFIEPIDPRIVRLGLTVDLSHEIEDVSDAALAFFADALATKTKTRDREEIVSYLNRHGIQLAIEAGTREIMCSLDVAERNLKAALLILADILRNAELTADEFARIQRRTLEELREAKDNAKLIARINFARAIYSPDDPRRGETLDEQVAIIQKLTVRDFARMKAKMLGGRWYISAVAATQNRPLLERFATAFSHDVKATPVELSAAQASTKHVFETVSGKTNVELRLGHRIALSQTDAEYPALTFGLSVLGNYGGFGGRLMSTVREKEGLTYGIYARIEETRVGEPGHWNIFTFFTACDLEKGLRSTMRQLNLLLEKGVTERECAVFKEMYRNAFLITHESNARRLRYYHALLANGLNEEWALAFEARIAGLTRREVNEALRAHLDPKRMVISGAGPVNKKGEGIV